MEASPTRGAGLDRALPLDRAGARQDRFEKRGLAALEGAHQRDAPGTLGSCAAIAICSRHRRLLGWRRTAGMIRPQVLTPEGYRLKGMWRWQVAGRSNSSRLAELRRGSPVAV